MSFSSQRKFCPLLICLNMFKPALEVELVLILNHIPRGQIGFPASPELAYEGLPCRSTFAWLKAELESLDSLGRSQRLCWRSEMETCLILSASLESSCLKGRGSAGVLLHTTVVCETCPDEENAKHVYSARWDRLLCLGMWGSTWQNPLGNTQKYAVSKSIARHLI